MSRPFARGRIVARGAEFGIVWDDRGGRGFEILEVILAPTNTHRFDVPYAIVPGAVIRPKAVPVCADGYELTGALPGPTWSEVAHAMAHQAREVLLLSRWSGDREHKRRARSEVMLAV
jgi:hypothetical protein